MEKPWASTSPSPMDSTRQKTSTAKKPQNSDGDLDHLLILALRTLSRAAKKTKAFEIQHLVRKLRAAKEGKPIRKKEAAVVDVQSLEAALEKFKLINVENLSKKILFARLKRQSPDLITHSIFNDILKANEPIQLDRIENQICSQKSLAELIKQTVAKLLLLHLQPPPVKQPHAQAKPAPGGNSSARQSRPASGSSQLPGSEDDGELLGDELDEAVARELAGLEASSTREGSSGAAESPSDTSDDDPSDENESLSSHSSSYQHPAPAKKIRLSKPTQPKPSTLPSSSTFLPALNVGYTLGDSDGSDLDIDDLAVDRMERERGRKNRKGQQARRAIWEKKFGKSAKHLLKLKQSHGDKHQKPEERDRARFSQRASSHGTTRAKNGTTTTGSNAEPLAAAHKTPVVDPKLHPSWIAKQNQLKALSLLKPTGKKITFD